MEATTSSDSFASYEVPPPWFLDAVHTNICNGEISSEDGLALCLFPPAWAYAEAPKSMPKKVVVLAEGRICTKCKILCPSEDFYVYKSGKVLSWCRGCMAKQRRDHRAGWTPEQRSQKLAKDRERPRRRKKAA